jgi:hypothetical protein
LRRGWTRREASGDDALAGPAAVYEHVGIRRAYAFDDLKHGLHCGDSAMSLVSSSRSIRFSLQAAGLSECLSEFSLGVDDGEQPRIIPGLLNKVARRGA